ncbi:MAG: Veg family protein [Bacilli bacterium]|nr:Veg family protein [Bacilli bacterium]
MTISEVRSELINHLGEEVTIKYNLGRNKFEKYNVVIKELYKNIFLVELKENLIKSFSYTDVINSTIKIIY